MKQNCVLSSKDFLDFVTQPAQSSQPVHAFDKSKASTFQQCSLKAEAVRPLPCVLHYCKVRCSEAPKLSISEYLAFLSQLVLWEERWTAGFPRDRSHSCVGSSLFPSENPCRLIDTLNRVQNCQTRLVLVLSISSALCCDCSMSFLAGGWGRGGGNIAFLLPSQRICKHKLAYSSSFFFLIHFHTHNTLV